MGTLNRNVLVIRYKQKMLEWLNQDTPIKLSLDEINSNSPIFLIPECESVLDFEDDGDELKEYAFQEIMALWSSDPNTWPLKEMNSKNFEKWFDYSLHETAIDIAESPLKISES